MIDTPTWFGAADRALFGWFCVPDDRKATLSVVLCPPIGEEEHNAHETFRRLAWSLASHGIASLRFDYFGTGDSTGPWPQSGAVDAWLQSVEDAHAELRAAGSTRVAAVGMRIGATLLATAAQQGRLRLVAAALWDPCSGRSMLREGFTRRTGRREHPDGAVDTPGYLYSPDTAEGLRRLDLVALPEGQVAQRMLVLLRPDRPEPRGLRRRFEGGGVEWAEGEGQAELLDRPMTDSVAPVVATNRIVSWLQADAGPAPADVLCVPDRGPEILVPGTSIKERVVRLGRIKLFGMLTEPATRTRRPLVVFVNVANDRHLGPGRLWVDSARTLASEGYRVLRIGLSATGDSPAHPGQQFGTIYSREWLDELPEALTDPQLAAEDLVIISLCSGAYSAMETAARIPVSTVYPINVILSINEVARGEQLFDSSRRIARPPNRAFLPWYRDHWRAAAATWRVYRQFTVWNHPMSAVRTLVRRRTAVVLVMGPNDGRHFRESVFWNALFSWRWERQGLYRLISDADIDHTLMTPEGQATAMVAIVADLNRRYPEAVRAPL